MSIAEVKKWHGMTCLDNTNLDCWSKNESTDYYTNYLALFCLLNIDINVVHRCCFECFPCTTGCLFYRQEPTVGSMELHLTVKLHRLSEIITLTCLQ